MAGRPYQAVAPKPMAEEKQKLGRYTLLEKIAQGGMAQVFKAKTVDPGGFERLVVIKRILPHISEDPEYVAMLIDEAKIAVHFTHGNIAQIYDLGRVQDDYFIVMEYVDGKTFSQISKRLKQVGKRFPLDVLLYCAIEVCRALSYIHEKKGPDGKPLGVVHRDISPQNIILSYSGNTKIIDFGVAKATVRKDRTESGVLKGKFAYMSPEQARSDVIDWRSDIFSMGTLLWEMATGERLFKKRTNQETIQAIQKAKHPAASEVRRDLPKDFDRILKRALKKNPKHRYQDARDMAADLERLLFQINPEFKPVMAAEFVYKLFGPEEDEKELGDPLFEKEETPPTQLHGVREEPTVKDFGEQATPVVRFLPRIRVANQLWWLLGFVVFLFICGTVYVYLAARAEHGSVVLEGYERTMTVFVNGQRLKEIPREIKLKSEQDYEIRVTRPGYKDFAVRFLLKPYERKIIPVKMLKKAPLRGNLIITTSPPGATLYINDKEYKDKTPVVLKDLPAKQKYKIGLFLEKHQFHTEEVTILPGRDVTLQHLFKKTFAYLSLTTDPIGATVTINGKEVGHTPYQNNNLRPDEPLDVLIEKAGYEPLRLELVLKPGEERNLNLVLERVVEGKEAK